MEFLGAQLGDPCLSTGGDNLVSQRSLFFQDRINFFFDGAAGNEFIDRDLSFLADPIGTIGRLVFDGRVPPSIKMEDGGSLG